MMNMYR